MLYKEPFQIPLSFFFFFKASPLFVVVIDSFFVILDNPCKRCFLLPALLKILLLKKHNVLFVNEFWECCLFLVWKRVLMWHKCKKIFCVLRRVFYVLGCLLMFLFNKEFAKRSLSFRPFCTCIRVPGILEVFVPFLFCFVFWSSHRLRPISNLRLITCN